MLLSLSGAKGQTSYIYKIFADDTLRMDVYQPRSPRTDRACVIYLHDGGFRAGSRDDTLSRVSCRAWSDRGFVTISVDYHLSVNDINFDSFSLSQVVPTAEMVFGNAVEDCSSAVAFVLAHDVQWNIDTSKIILVGSSAGAITVLQTDYCRSNGSLWTAALPDDFHFAAVVSYAGAVFSNSGAIEYRDPPAPTCFFHGTKDKIVNYKQMALGRYRFSGSSSLAEIFNEENYTYMFYRLDGLAHDVFHFMPNSVDEFVAFVDMALSGRFFQYETDCYNVKIKTEPRFSKSIITLVK